MDKVKMFHMLDNLEIGGVQTVLMNILEAIDKDKYEIHIVVFDNDKKEFYEDKIKKMGIRLIKIPRVNGNYFKYVINLFKVIKNNGPYDIVHSHLHLSNGFVLFIATLFGINTRISHSHSIKRGDESQTITRKTYEYTMKKLISTFSNMKIASSLDAGYYMYGKDEFESKGFVLQNAIDVNEFEFSEKSRSYNRIKLNIKDKIVLGNIASLRLIKNQTFLLDILKEIVNNNHDAVLLIIGDGIEKENLIRKAIELDIENRVMFLGNRTDIGDLLSAMDIFLLPSLSEGLGIVAIEAQANGIPVVISDGVPREVMVNDNVIMLSLDASVQVWARNILELMHKRVKPLNPDLIKAGYGMDEFKDGVISIYQSNRSSLL